jgi:CubicO group peptidase (beta-lactamase class C family)
MGCSLLLSGLAQETCSVRRLRRPFFARSSVEAAIARLRVCVPVAAIALTGTIACDGREAPTLPSDIDPADFSAVVSDLRYANRIPAVSGIVLRGDSVIWEDAIGVRNIETGELATTGTLFHLSYITQAYAAVVLLQLVEEGRLRLEQPVSDFGISLAEPDTVRVWHLMSGTSFDNPGSEFHCCERFRLLDEVVLGATDETFGELFEARIRRPLGLENTTPNLHDTAAFAITGLSRSAVADSLARGYDYAPAQRNIAVEYQPYFGTSSGLISSPRDVATFARALTGTTLLSSTSKARMYTPIVARGGTPLPFALGWYVGRFNGHLTYWQNGFWAGASGLLIVVPEKELTFVMLANNEMLNRPGHVSSGNLFESLFARAFFLAFVE